MDASEEAQREEAPQLSPAVRENGRHPVNIGHLVMGILFAGLVGAYLMYASNELDVDGLKWAIPVIFIVGGAVGLLAAVMASLRRST